MRKKDIIFILLISFGSMQSFADELCDLYKIPGDCLNESLEALHGLSFEPARMSNSLMPKDLTVLNSFPSQNPLGLIVYAYIRENKICAIRYSRSTHLHAMNMDEFDEFKSKTVSYYDKTVWRERLGDRSKTLKYDDGQIQITISNAHLMFKSIEKCD